MSEHTMKYAALITSTYSIPGDERSRTHPGHGYPASTGESTDLKVFKDRAEMETWVKSQTAYSRTTNFKLIRYEELTYETTVTVNVKVT